MNIEFEKLAEEFIDKQDPIGDIRTEEYWQMKAWEKGVKDFAKYLIDNLTP